MKHLLVKVTLDSNQFNPNKKPELVGKGLLLRIEADPEIARVIDPELLEHKLTAAVTDVFLRHAFDLGLPRGYIKTPVTIDPWPTAWSDVPSAVGRTE